MPCELQELTHHKGWRILTLHLVSGSKQAVRQTEFRPLQNRQVASSISYQISSHASGHIKKKGTVEFA